MTRPEDALELARRRAAARRAAGDYPEDAGSAGLEPQPLTLAKLLEWASIEPDLRDVRSTRRFGAPMTLFKRVLLRVLAQYHAQLIAQQTRFNVNLVGYVRRLEERLEALEQDAQRR